MEMRHFFLQKYAFLKFVTIFCMRLREGEFIFERNSCKPVVKE